MTMFGGGFGGEILTVPSLFVIPSIAWARAFRVSLWPARVSRRLWRRHPWPPSPRLSGGTWGHCGMKESGRCFHCWRESSTSGEGCWRALRKRNSELVSCDVLFGNPFAMISEMVGGGGGSFAYYMKLMLSFIGTNLLNFCTKKLKIRSCRIFTLSRVCVEIEPTFKDFYTLWPWTNSRLFLSPMLCMVKDSMQVSKCFWRSFFACPIVSKNQTKFLNVILNLNRNDKQSFTKGRGSRCGVMICPTLSPFA